MQRLESAVHIAYLACYGRHVGPDMPASEATFLIRNAYPEILQRVHKMLAEPGNERGPEEGARDYYQRMAGRFLQTKRRPFAARLLE